MREHVHDAGSREAETEYVHQILGIARQCRRIARDIHNALDAVPRQALDRLDGAVARRVEQQLVKAEAIPRRRRCGVIRTVALLAALARLVIKINPLQIVR